MKIKEFLSEFDNDQFPQIAGPWVNLDAHDPPFTRTELNRMSKAGIIEADFANSRYRLTIKAAKYTQ